MEFPFKDYRIPTLYNINTCYKFVERLQATETEPWTFEKHTQPDLLSILKIVFTNLIDSANSITTNALR